MERWRRRLAGIILLFTLFVAGIGLLAWDFARRMQTSLPDGAGASHAVVFSGQFDRIDAGLDLLQTGKIGRLLISGANRPAGIDAGDFTRQFKLSAELQQALGDGRLVLGRAAGNTLQNAAETACWRGDQGLGGPILLVTSRRHMPRASLALEQVTEPDGVWRLGIPDEGNAFVGPDGLHPEFLKYLATRLAGSLPSVITRDALGEFSNGCP